MTRIVQSGASAAGTTAVTSQIASLQPEQKHSAQVLDFLRLKNIVLSQPLLLDALELDKLEIHRSGSVDLRRDLHLFLKYVESHTIKRSHRLNEIPKADEQRLSKILSHRGDWTQHYNKPDSWCDYVSQIARVLGLVSFDTKGVYAGYSSQSASYPDNYIELNKAAQREYIERTPVQKERAVLKALASFTGNEFFCPPTLISGKTFSYTGSGIGPASKMNLPKIRDGLLKMLLDLKPDIWYSAAYVLELLRKTVPHLILDPSTREPDYQSRQKLNDWQCKTQRERSKCVSGKPEVTFEDIYTNFKEYKAGDEYESKPRQIKSQMPDAFERVEGRYFENFLSEIPFILGYVDLAFRPKSDRTGLDVHPPLDRLRGFRLTPRFFMVLGQDDTAINTVKTTVLPNFEVIVEAVSYPDILLEPLSAYATVVKEAHPIYHLKLERKKVVEATATAAPNAKGIQDILVEACGAALPSNVGSELSSWTSIAEKVILYENVSLLEWRGDTNQIEELRQTVHDSVIDDRLKKFVIVDNDKTAFSRLEAKHLVPVKIIHHKDRLTASEGALALRRTKKEMSKQSALKTAGKTDCASIPVEAQDVVCFRVPHKGLLAAIRKQLADEIIATSMLIVSGDLIVLSACELPKWRTALRKLSEKFNVDL